jgi:hypothetical protein
MSIRKAVVDGSTVENVIIAGDGFELPGKVLVPVPDGEPVSFGWTYADGQFSAPSNTEIPSDFPLLPWQFKAMVMYLDKDAEIQAAIGQIPDDMQRAAAMSRYQNATYYHFGDPLLQSIRVALDMNIETLTEAWLRAKNLRST